MNRKHTDKTEKQMDYEQIMRYMNTFIHSDDCLAGTARKTRDPSQTGLIIYKLILKVLCGVIYLYGLKCS